MLGDGGRGARANRGSRTARSYWLRGAAVRGRPRAWSCAPIPWSSPADVTPAGFNVRTKVHEYGGGSFVVHRGVVFFSNFADQRLYRQDPGARAGADHARHRRASSVRRRRASRPTARWLICVRERHEARRRRRERARGRPDRRLRASRRAIVSAGGTSTAAPRISPDGTKLAWLAWDLPWMPWDGCELWVGRPRRGRRPSPDARLVAGADGEESIWQPGWSPAGDAAFRQRPHAAGGTCIASATASVTPLCPMEAEFGWPALGVRRRRSYAFLDDGRIACMLRTRTASQHVARPGPADRGAARSRPAVHRDRLPVSRRRGIARSRSSRAAPTARRRSCRWTSSRGRSTCCGRATRLASTRRSCRRPARSSSRPTAASPRYAHLLPAGERRLRRRRRASGRR